MASTPTRSTINKNNREVVGVQTPQQQQGGTTLQQQLTDDYKKEIRIAFDVFDDDKIGEIDVNSFKTMIRALGFQVTKEDIWDEVRRAHGERRRKQQRQRRMVQSSFQVTDDEEEDENDYNDRIGQENSNEKISTVDLDMAYEIMSSQYYSNRDPEVEMDNNFQLFDADNTGYITFDNLRFIARELGQVSMGEDQLRSMIDAFDGDLDGQISKEEFRRIMMMET
mmetsp:Transcript_30842/g.45341  ORF Transcript_30842/g.45341 Transcript_30842/m.45341 type:complete len:224 (-) Transcript_30842:303-974(-)